MHFQIPEICFISAYVFGVSDTLNIENHLRLKNELLDKNIGFHIVHGTCKGVDELSFMVYCDYPAKKDKYYFLAIAKRFNQEAIVYRDNMRCGYLLFTKNGDEEKIGLITEITAEEAGKLENYSYFPLMDTYLGVKS